MCCPRCVTQASHESQLLFCPYLWGLLLLASYDPSKNSKCSLCDHTSFAPPSMLEGTLFDVARFRARCAFGLDMEILGRDLDLGGAVRYRKHMNICPSLPNGPIAIGISAWLLSRI